MARETARSISCPSLQVYSVGHSALSCWSGPCLGCLWGAPAHLGTGHSVFLGWDTACGKDTPPCPDPCPHPAPLPGHVRYSSCPSPIFAGLPAGFCTSGVGAAPQHLELTCRCPPATLGWLPQPTSALSGWSILGWGDGAG